MRCALLLSLLFSCPLVLAQEDALAPVRTFSPHALEAPLPVDTPVVPMRSLQGNVTITEDPGVKELMGQYSEVKDELKGYRVQIFLGTREQANPLRAAFLQKNPDVPAYLSYLAPNFRVRVGDLRDRREAEKLRLALKDAYPGAYIVQDDIELPPLPE